MYDVCGLCFICKNTINNRAYIFDLLLLIEYDAAKTNNSQIYSNYAIHFIFKYKTFFFNFHIPYLHTVLYYSLEKNFDFC